MTSAAINRRWREKPKRRDALWRFTYVLLLVGILGAGGAISLSRSHQGWQLADIRGHLPDLRFSLTDDEGHKVTAQDYHGEVTLLYFGFTGCSTQCPVTMERLRHVLAHLGEDANRVRVLFVTVNPQNDTPSVLHQYLARLDPMHMTGLTGSAQAIEALAKRCRAAFRLAGGSTPAHSNAVYVFDAKGRACLLISPKDNNAAIEDDIRRLGA